MAGGSPSIGALLTADSDRGRGGPAPVHAERRPERRRPRDRSIGRDGGARRQEARLRRAAREQARATADLEAERDQIDEKVARLADVVQELQAELEAAEQAELGIGGDVPRRRPERLDHGHRRDPDLPRGRADVVRGLLRRSAAGGRTHEGIDLIAATARRSWPSRPDRLAGGEHRGLGVVIQHGNGDWTFYAHLSSYGSLGSVSTGTVIGYVGPGNGVNHLHFEYHRRAARRSTRTRRSWRSAEGAGCASPPCRRTIPEPPHRPDPRSSYLDGIASLSLQDARPPRRVHGRARVPLAAPASRPGARRDPPGGTDLRGGGDDRPLVDRLADILASDSTGDVTRRGDARHAPRGGRCCSPGAASSGSWPTPG